MSFIIAIKEYSIIKITWLIHYEIKSELFKKVTP